jgi:hypothetical protein
MATASLLMTAGSAPSTPASGKAILFFNASNNFAFIDATGRTLDLVSGPATYSAAPGDPTGTTNTTGLMMGLAGSITPAFSGRIFLSITGNLSSSTTTAARGSKCQARYGTNTAPANGAALTGTAVGTICTYLAWGTTANQKAPFACNAVITGLTLGTAYWLDLGVAAVTGDTASVKDISIQAFEV